MIRVAIFIVLVLVFVVSCTLNSGIPFDESMTAVQEAGYLLSAMKTADLRCYQGLEKDGARVVFMHVYCAIDDQIDMMNFNINPRHSHTGEEKMLDALELIGFPDSQRVVDFVLENESQIFRGKYLQTTIGTWRVSASTTQGGADLLVLVGLRSERFLDEAGK